MRGRWDLNPHPLILKNNAIPLSYFPNNSKKKITILILYKIIRSTIIVINKLQINMDFTIVRYAI